MKKLIMLAMVLGLLLNPFIAHSQDDIALGGTATQSSSYPSRYGSTEAPVAIDGVTGGNGYLGQITHTLGNTPNEWWKVDLNGTYHLGQIVLWNRTDCCPERLSNFNVSVLDGNGNTVWSGNYYTQGGYPNPSFVITLPNNVYGEFIKITLNGWNYLSLAEVQVYIFMYSGYMSDPAVYGGSHINANYAWAYTTSAPEMGVELVPGVSSKSWVTNGEYGQTGNNINDGSSRAFVFTQGDGVQGDYNTTLYGSANITKLPDGVRTESFANTNTFELGASHNEIGGSAEFYSPFPFYPNSGGAFASSNGYAQSYGGTTEGHAVQEATAFGNNLESSFTANSEAYGHSSVTMTEQAKGVTSKPPEYPYWGSQEIEATIQGATYQSNKTGKMLVEFTPTGYSSAWAGGGSDSNAGYWTRWTLVRDPYEVNLTLTGNANAEGKTSLGATQVPGVSATAWGVTQSSSDAQVTGVPLGSTQANGNGSIMTAVVVNNGNNFAQASTSSSYSYGTPAPYPSFGTSGVFQSSGSGSAYGYSNATITNIPNGVRATSFSMSGARVK